MVTGLITGPNRILDLNIKEALDRSGVYALHTPEDMPTSEGTQALIQAQRARTPGVVYYRPELATDRREGRLFSVAPVVEAEKRVGQTALSEEAPLETIPGAQLELIPLVSLEPVPAPPAVEMMESLAA